MTTSDKLLEALSNEVTDDRKNIDVVWDLKQVQNTIHRERIKSQLGDDEIYHLNNLVSPNATNGSVEPDFCR